MGIYYRINSKLHFGLGPSWIRKLDADLTRKQERLDPERISIIKFDYSSTYFGINGGATLDLDLFRINIDYLYKFNEEHLLDFARYTSDYRWVCTLSVPIKLGK